MENPIKQVYRFNKEAGLLNKGYDDFLESSFQVEEALEGLNHLDKLATLINVPPETPKLPKAISRAIVNIAHKGHTSNDRYSVWSDLSDLERLDKACDAIVFALGSIFKLGLNPTQATRALNAVMKANMQKLSMPKDEHGKLLKPDSFVGPEPELQTILDER